MTWETILTILASLSIPSILVSIFLYKQNRKYKKWEAKRDLKLKEIEFEEEIDRNGKEFADFMNSTSFSNFSKIEPITYDPKNSERKIKKIIAEIDYLSKVSGEKNPYDLFVKQTFWQKIKSKIKWKK